MDDVHPVDEGLGFDEVDEQAPGEVGGHEDAKERAVGVWPAAEGVEDRGEQEEEDDFVELGGMARDAVAEVDGPGERGGLAVGVVGEAGEEAADAADGDAEAEGDGEEVARTGADAEERLGDFHDEPAAEKASDDGFAAGEKKRRPVEADARGLLQQAEEAAAGECAECGGGEDEPSPFVGEGVASACALYFIEAVSGGVGEGLEDGVQRGMGGEGHGRSEPV